MDEPESPTDMVEIPASTPPAASTLPTGLERLAQLRMLRLVTRVS